MSATENFYARDKWHEKACVEHILPILNERGFETFPHGIEIRNDIKDRIKTDDRCSLMMRFRPDIYTIIPKVRSVLCEVKSKPPRFNNKYAETFTWEARSYLALREWNKGGENVAMLAMHDFNTGNNMATWFDDISSPDTIFIPQRWDCDEQCAVMDSLFPHARKKFVEYHVNHMSGTPFISVYLSDLHDLDDFIDVELLGIRSNLSDFAI